MHSYGWKGSFTDFLAIKQDQLLDSLCQNIFEKPYDHAKLDNSSMPQIRAWIDCYHTLYNAISSIHTKYGFIIFEYSILRGSGRRPDVLIILPGEILVLEFKSYKGIRAAEYTQTSLYVRDLQNYHSAIHHFNLRVTGALTLTAHTDERLLHNEHEQIHITSSTSLTKLLKMLEKRGQGKDLISDIEFISGEFHQLPSIIESAKKILRNESLPQIRTIKSSNFDHVVEETKNIIEFAKENDTHHLVLISGVPGAGKTFVGLKLAHEVERAVYLSGNGPLVDVLQDSLQNDTFVQSLYGYKTDYLKHKRVPYEQVIIFDEAQRAWDSQRMNSSLSEPDVIVQIAKHNKPWSVVIGLIGEGQEIHIGEEGGLALWNFAIKNQQAYVHSKHNLDLFSHAVKHYQNKHLHLNSSLRTHAAIEYYQFVNLFLNQDFKQAAKISSQFHKYRYVFKVTRDLEKAKQYVAETYSNNTTKTFGIVCATGNDYTKEIPIVPFPERYQKPKPIVSYFNYPSSKYYTNRLQYAATEFQTQGLELDMSIVHWDKDLYLKHGEWQYQYLKRNVLSPEQMKLNAYRVLMTRGRDGTILYIPRHKELDELFHTLTNYFRLSLL